MYRNRKYLFLIDSNDKLKLDCIEKTFKATEKNSIYFVLFQAINNDEEQDNYLRLID